MKQNRREFLIKSSGALSMVGLATQARHFGLMSAMAQSFADDNSDLAPTDYRALVCVYMRGGNDGNNMVIPNHNSTTGGISNYAAYRAARGTQGLALAQSDLLSINVPRVGSLAYGIHKNLGTMIGRTDLADNNGTLGGTRNAGLHDLWAAGKLAIVPNVGNLVAPITRAEYQANTVQKPYQLFSHNDQSDQQMTAQSVTRSYTGWGGRIADIRDTPDNPGALIPMISSIAGAQVFTLGQTSSPLTLPSGGTTLANAFVLQGYSTSPTDLIGQGRRAGLNELRTVDLNQNVIRAASNITDQAVTASTALAANPQEVTVTFPNTTLGGRLKQVARLIKKRSDLITKRQIFFVEIANFDTHTKQVAGIDQGQNGLFIQLGQALRAFYDEMTVQGISNGVTTFTISDFGRTLVPTGTGTGTVGSDHAWGSHAFVMGGAVRGGDFYGVNSSNGTPFPTLLAGGPDDTDSRGRWIPTTSVEQYAATLSKWYGLPDSQRATVFPNIGNYILPDLGFMNP